MPGEDANELWVRDGALGPPWVRLFARSRWTTPEDVGASTLLWLPDPGLCIVADARLDNRRELAANLGLSEAGRSDSSLILSAYLRWGRETSRYLVGDFAFVLWDERHRLLFAGRDVLGVRALHYRVASDGVLVGSTVGSVRTDSVAAVHLNRDYLTRFIEGRPAKVPDQTPWSNVHRLRPGHILSATDRAVSTHWSDRLSPIPTPNTSSDQECWSQFRALLDQAVSRRLRTVHPAGIMLSGGFDSSSIAVLANKAVADGVVDARLMSFSAVFDDGSRGDERAYLDAVLGATPHITPHRQIWHHEWSLDRLGPGDGITLDEPPENSRFMGVMLTRFAADAACRVMLSGLWADQLILRQPYFHGGLLWDLPLKRMCFELPRFVRTAGLQRVAFGATKAGFRQLSARLNREAPQSALSALLADRFIWGSNGVGMIHNDGIARSLGVENRNPFLDRDLQAFVRGLSAGALFRAGERKLLLRRALHDVLPESFRQRETFAAVTHLYVSGVNRERSRMLEILKSPRVLDLKLVTEARVRQVRALLQHDVRAHDINPIKCLVAAEVWIQHTLK